jgi:hypothetical protein
MADLLAGQRTVREVISKWREFQRERLALVAANDDLGGSRDWVAAQINREVERNIRPLRTLLRQLEEKIAASRLPPNSTRT